VTFTGCMGVTFIGVSADIQNDVNFCAQRLTKRAREGNSVAFLHFRLIHRKPKKVLFCIQNKIFSRTLMCADHNSFVPFI